MNHSQDDVMRGVVVWMEICLLSMEKEEVEDNEDNEDSFLVEILGGYHPSVHGGRGLMWMHETMLIFDD